jgi:hypothetical protein
MMTAYRFLWTLALSGNVLLAAGSVAAQGTELNLDVTAKCEEKKAQFEIINKGERWAGMAMISLQQVDTGAVISQREMRMVPGQRVVFRAREASAGVGVRIRVEPDWYKRPPGFDAEISCE